MNKKAVGTGVACGVCLGTTIIAYAIIIMFLYLGLSSHTG